MFPNSNIEPTEILEIFDKRPTVIKPGLDRIRSALSVINYPGQRTPIILVGGTNGKGTTSGMIYRMLASSGLRVGFFSSPHLIQFKERISVSDQDVSNEIISRHILKLKSAVPSELWDALSFFEINTIIAFQIFDEMQTDLNVLEVGLGGRFDSTNVYDPLVSVITSIGVDHTEFLGNTETSIAAEKSGIMREGRPIVWSGLDSSSKEADDEIRRQAKLKNSNLVCGIPLNSIPLPKLLKIRPGFWLKNFSLACAAVDEFLKMSHHSHLESKLKSKSWSTLVEKFDDPTLPWPATFNGRFDLVRVFKNDVSQTVLLDVCHNPHGARGLHNGLIESGMTANSHKLPCLISILTDKDITGIWNEIKVNIGELIKFKIPSPRTWKSEDNRIQGPIKESFAEAWESAMNNSSWRSSQPWLIFGSVAAVGDVFKFWENNGWSLDRNICIEG